MHKYEVERNNFQKMKKTLIVIFIIIGSLNIANSTSSPMQDLVIPAKWVGCQGVEGNLNKDLVATEATVIQGFWSNILGMKIGEEKNFIVFSNQHEYTGELYLKDLFYLVRINTISNGNIVNSASSVQIFYSLYINCQILTDSSQTSTSSPTASSSSSPEQPPDNTLIIIAVLGIVAGGGVIGYFAIIRPRSLLPEDAKSWTQNQSKKQLNQTKELLDIIQDKKEANGKLVDDNKSPKPRSSSRPRRR